MFLCLCVGLSLSPSFHAKPSLNSAIRVHLLLILAIVMMMKQKVFHVLLRINFSVNHSHIQHTGTVEYQNFLSSGVNEHKNDFLQVPP